MHRSTAVERDENRNFFLITTVPIKLIKSDTLCKSWRKVIPMESAIEENDQDEADSNQDEADDRDCCTDCRHEVGCDVNQEELEAWLNSDCNDSCFLIVHR